MIEAIAFATLAIMAVASSATAVVVSRRANARRRERLFPFELGGLGVRSTHPYNGAARLIERTAVVAERVFRAKPAIIKRHLASLNVEFHLATTDGAYVMRNGQKLAGWVDNDGAGTIHVVIPTYENNLRATAFVHEMLHALAHRLIGDSDPEHKREAIWVAELEVRGL